MRKRYNLSMLSIYPLILAFNGVYYAMHKSVEIFLMSSFVHFIFFGIFNWISVHFLYKPIHLLMMQEEDSNKGIIRIKNITWYSTVWVFLLGLLYVILIIVSLILFPDYFDDSFPGQLPSIFFITMTPSLLFVYAIFPSFITYFLINDFSLDLRSKAYELLRIPFPVGKNRIGLILLLVFIILGFLPTVLVILDVVGVSIIEDQFTEFMKLDPLETVLVDRFVVLIGFIIAVIFITRSFTKPIYSLLNKMKKVREGNYSTRAAIISEDEIGVLTKEFNDMVSELEISHQKLEEYSHTLENKVEERTRELKKKNAELQLTLDKLNQMQQQAILQEKMASLGQLVAGLTHEFNTPIGAIKSMNDTKSKALKKLQSALNDGSGEHMGDNSEIKNVMNVISKADHLIDQGTERLSEIILNLKNFVKLDEAEATVADIHENLDIVLTLISQDMLANIKVIRDYGEIPPFLCNPGKLNQVFLNIIKNACQAIEGEGEITIETRQVDEMIKIAIQDTGKGIEPERMESIFDPNFITKHNSVRASLGLSICYQIVQEHQGRIEVESEPGKGSVFKIILPSNLKEEDFQSA